MAELKLSGYRPGKELAAQRIRRGNRAVYVVSLPIDLVPVHLPVPDPENPIDQNRLVRQSHAKAFGDYWAKQPDMWTVPPLLVDTVGPLTFERKEGVEGGAEWGVLIIPNNSKDTLRTLDGQHRILGWALKSKELEDVRNRSLNRIADAHRTGDKDAAARAKAELTRAEATLARMQREQVTLEIMTNVTDAEHKSFFIDIADNALGINASERTRMDEQNLDSIVARALSKQVLLLLDRTEERQASAGKKSKDVMSLKNVRDIVRHTCFGISGRITANRAKKIRPETMEEISKRFFLAMTDASPDLKAIVGGTYLPKDLRQESLLGSVTVWRCLAGTYHDLAVTATEEALVWSAAGHDKFKAFVSALVPTMRIKEKKIVDGRWVKTTFVNDGELAPRSRAQDLKGLTALFTSWASNQTPFNPAAPS